MLRRLEHVPIATAVRLPTRRRRPHRQGARRRRRRRHRRDDRVRRAGRGGGRRDPVRTRRGAQLRAAAGEHGHRPRSAAGAGLGVRDGRDRAGAGRNRRDLRRRRADRHLRRARRSGDLHWGTARPTRGPSRSVRDAMLRIQHIAAVGGLDQPASTPTPERIGNTTAQLGFRMITLASESQALRRGAAAHLAEALGASTTHRQFRQPARGYY